MSPKGGHDSTRPGFHVAHHLFRHLPEHFKVTTRPDAQPSLQWKEQFMDSHLLWMLAEQGSHTPYWGPGYPERKAWLQGTCRIFSLPQPGLQLRCLRSGYLTVAKGTWLFFIRVLG